MTKTAISTLVFLFSLPLFAQWASVPSTSYPALETILNAKPAVTTGSGAPSANCTQGKDIYLNTATGDAYFCTATNTWAFFGSQNAVLTTGTYSNPSWLTGLAWSKISSAPSFLTAPVALSSLATQAADTVLVNASGSSAAPTAVALPTSGTSGCAGASNALTYNTSTHAYGCNTIGSGSALPSVVPVYMDTAGNTRAMTQNVVYCTTWVNPAAGTLNALIFLANTGAGLWSGGILQGGTFLAGGKGTAGSPGSNLPAVSTFSALALPAGQYGVCVTSSGASDVIWNAGQSSAGYYGAMVNAGLSSPNLNYYSCANPSVSGVMPNTCGTQTAISSAGGSTLFAFNVR